MIRRQKKAALTKSIAPDSDQKILIAKTLINSADYTSATDLRKHEFKVYSQWGEDGIIQYLINYLEIETQRFIEFGVENFTEANCRFLLINNNWSGLVIDGSEDNIEFIKRDQISWKFDLISKCSFIDKDNIEDIISRSGFSGEIGILSIDIDGNDYWVWEAINNVNPVIVIAEYNSVFGPNRPISVPYDPNFIRSEKHYSNLYYGASIQSLCDLAESKNYSLVGSNLAGNNVFFVRNDKLKDLKKMSAEEAYVQSKFKESRDKNGKLSYLPFDKRQELLSGIEVVNTRTNQIEKF